MDTHASILYQNPAGYVAERKTEKMLSRGLLNSVRVAKHFNPNLGGLFRGSLGGGGGGGGGGGNSTCLKLRIMLET